MGGMGLGQKAEARSSVVQVKGSDTILNASQAIAEKFMSEEQRSKNSSNWWRIRSREYQL